jgi:transposase
VVVRLRRHQPTRDYIARRLAEGRTKNEIIRCLKRYLAREIFHALQPPRPTAEIVAWT